MFTCFEGTRPMLFDTLHTTAGRRVSLREPFVESCVPDSLFVFSCAPARAVPVGARIENGEVITEGDECAVTVVVAGIHKHWPSCDLPEVTEAQRARSWAYWAREWKD